MYGIFKDLNKTQILVRYMYQGITKEGTEDDRNKKCIDDDCQQENIVSRVKIQLDISKEVLKIIASTYIISTYTVCSRLHFKVESAHSL